MDFHKISSWGNFTNWFYFHRPYFGWYIKEEVLSHDCPQEDFLLFWYFEKLEDKKQVLLFPFFPYSQLWLLVQLHYIDLFIFFKTHRFFFIKNATTSFLNVESKIFNNKSLGYWLWIYRYESTFHEELHCKRCFHCVS